VPLKPLRALRSELCAPSQMNFSFFPIHYVVIGLRVASPSCGECIEKRTEKSPQRSQSHPGDAPENSILEK